MPEQSELGRVLIDCRVVTPRQWEKAVRTGGDDLDATLDALAADPPHWWDGQGAAPPGLTDYQREVIELRFAADELDQLPRDLSLNQFLLLGTLGRGGQGEVQRARQLNPPRYAAVKTLTRDTELRRRRFEQEARTMIKLQHPAVARFYLYERVRDAAGEPTDEYLIAMEFVNGTDLNRLVRRRGPVPWEFAAHWVAELLAGLAVIHRNGFIHRDVKPENVMIVGPEPGPGVLPTATTAKLLDFGAVKSGDVDLEEGLTTNRVFVGTPEYAPPEQWKGKLVPASDLYTLGGTLYFALTNRYPYQKQKRDAMAYMKSHLGDPVPDLQGVNPDVPDELNRLFRRMMAKDAAERGTAAELCEEFRRLMPQDPTRTPPPQPTPQRTGRPPTVPPKPSVPARPTPLRAAPTAPDPVPHGPFARVVDPVLALLERLFIPAHLRPPRGAEPSLSERLAVLIRRPLFLIILVIVLVLLVLWVR